jgi:PPIC-type PPIASE domain
MMVFNSKLLNLKDLEMTCRTAKDFLAPLIMVGLALLTLQPRPAVAQSGGGNSPSTAGQPVLIIHGECSPQPSAQQRNSADPSCDMVIKKEKFDNLVAATDPNMSASNRLVVATEYVRLWVMAQEAERLKLDQTPAFQELEQLLRLRALEQQLMRYLNKESTAISPQEIAAYYQEHLARFEQASLRKIYIPKQGQWTKVDAAQPIRQRAAQGEDFDALEHEVWSAQGRPSGAPLTRMGTLRLADLAESEQKVFDLKPGEVSELFEESGGFAIFKLETKRVQPLSEVENDIRYRLAGERMQERINKLRGAVSVSVNEDYFGTLPSTEELAKHHGMEHAGSHLMPMSDAEKNRR